MAYLDDLSCEIKAVEEDTFSDELCCDITLAIGAGEEDSYLPTVYLEQHLLDLDDKEIKSISDEHLEEYVNYRIFDNEALTQRLQKEYESRGNTFLSPNNLDMT